VAALYLHGHPPGAPGCDTNSFAPSKGLPGYLEFAMIHEIMHTLGFVAPCAPHFTLAGHVSDDPRDLMYAGPLPWQPSILDVGHDDYYDHGRLDCPDFARSPFLEPSSWPPTRVELQPQDCSEESTLRSQAANIPTSVEFANRASATARVYWLGYDGHRRLYATLQPGQAVVLDTFLTHPWLVTLAGQCSGIYLPIEEPASVTLKS
jgi:hypothetical protein